MSPVAHRVCRVTTALYRRYRPDDFAEMIGQDHVTAPLRQALRTGQVNHAYLFSGPRGCGKTTSARVLARILNCARNTEANPTDTPCGECPSCVELARGGPGSLDVVEIDAASHGGVDDARELRERATFAPARDRYKIFILDEAHMVTPQGFNALLKIVEEPPPHVKFVFATTEPDKVIGTIRSRTHHYPFRLVPPDVLVPYLEQLCEREGVTVGAGVLPLVVRAGGGSVRDTLSVLDQLIAGSDASGVDYEGAAALLGYTQASLLDDLVDAVAARDGGAAFRVVERVIATGHEPRRFVEDVLERLRDLIVIAASGEAAGAALRGVPADQLATMRLQASRLGAAELSRSADLANAALTEMVGATSPRLHLELLMARLLLPAADDSRSGLGARLDRLEREGAGAARVPAAREPDRPAAVPTPVRTAAPAAPPAPVIADDRASATATHAGSSATAPESAREAGAVQDSGDEAGASTDWPEPVRAAERGADREPDDAAAAPATAGEAAPGDRRAERLAPTQDAPVAPVPEPAAAGDPASGGQTEVLRRRWPEVLDTVKSLRRVTWALVDPANAQVAELDATTLRLAFTQPALATTFRNGGHADVVARAVRETLGFDVRVEPILLEPGSGPTPPSGGPSAPPSGGGAPRPGAGTPPASSAGRPVLPVSEDARRTEGAEEASDRGAGSRSTSGAAGADGPAAAAPGRMPPDGATAATRMPSAAEAAAMASWDEVPPAEPPADDEDAPPPLDVPPGPVSARAAGAAAAARAAARPEHAEPDEPSPDDPDISSGLVGAPLIAQMLGGRVIDEQVDDAG